MRCVIKIRSGVGFTRVAGFTLIELLVVIAVIGILAGILITALPAAFEKAQTTKKISRYRNLYVANQMYVAANKGYICPADDGSKKWQELLSPFLSYAKRGSDVFVDPVYERENPDNPNLTGIGMGIYFLTPEKWQRNVVYANDDEPLQGVKLFVVENQAFRILMGDSVKWFLTTTYADTTRHENGTKGMFLFFDGRVDLLSKQEAELGISNPAELKALASQSGN
jgi:prepilin-type N-terminal cleavage/methylation domain-containing protein/prepilin-type processing-associated H-X9-DG protein